MGLRDAAWPHAMLCARVDQCMWSRHMQARSSSIGASSCVTQSSQCHNDIAISVAYYHAERVFLHVSS